MIKVSPSVLSADFSNMGQACKDLEKCGCDFIHCDVMDGCFVEQITFGHKMIKDIHKTTSLPLDVHLMIVDPLKHLDNFCNAGSSIITLHYESVKDGVQNAIEEVKSRGVKVGLSIKPDTPVNVLDEYLPLLDLVLVMSVEPGKGGQSFLESAVDKISYLHQYNMRTGSNLIIEVDGGINCVTGKKCVDAGANLLVAGSYIFNSSSMKDAVASLKSL